MLEDEVLEQTAQKNYDVDILGSREELSEELARLCRKAAAEGIVILENDGLLPLRDTRVSVFGRVAVDYFYVGNGSGGDVVYPYRVNLMEGIENSRYLTYNNTLADIYAKWSSENVPPVADWGKWPTNYEEMPLTNEMIKEAKEETDVAVVVIGRCAGEDRDSVLEEGSFYLTKEELGMLDQVTTHFDKVILVINSGNIIDFSWHEKYKDKISAILYAWQGGMESGNAVVDVITGEINPGGKLPVTIASKYEQYPTAKNFGGKDYNNYAEDIFVGYRYFETFAPEDVLYPFGFGLGYTTFEIKCKNFRVEDGEMFIDFNVKNTGNMAGMEVVQVYYEALQGVLGEPYRQLIGFYKTDLLKPEQEENFLFSLSIDKMASYDDAGLTGHKSAYVLEAGDYRIFAGESVKDAKEVGMFNLPKLQVCQQLEEVSAMDPKHTFERLSKTGNTTIPTRTVSLKERILKNLPKEIEQTGDLGYKLQDVASGKITMEQFVGQLDITELEALTHGDFVMNSPLGVLGNAGTFGGIIGSLRDKGVIPVTTTDGPSGIRLKYYCSLLPCGMNLASTWDVELIERMFELHGQELAMRDSNVLLAPGMNIIRDPLCGRNFEYFSEDPLLSGRMGSSVVNGIQRSGRSACPKHFVANNQEAYRTINDSRMSERALREIYLKGFEICITESKPKNIMTSYNLINGVWGHYNYELCTHVLRGEWGYEGNIVTDWWMKPSVDPDFPNIHNDGYRIRAGVDVLMPGGVNFEARYGDGSLIESYEKEDGLTLAEVQRSAINVLNFVLSQLE